MDPIITNQLKPQRPRDVSHFIRLRAATPSDDLVLADLLLRTFISTYERKLPSVATSDERKAELKNVSARRRQGFVCVAELGYQVIGTFALIHPESLTSEAWQPGGATLRCLAIDPDFHGLDLSEVLILEAERIAKFWRANGIFLHVQAGADRVAALYERHGFVRDETGDKISCGNKLSGFRKELRGAS